MRGRICGVLYAGDRKGTPFQIHLGRKPKPVRDKSHKIERRAESTCREKRQIRFETFSLGPKESRAKKESAQKKHVGGENLQESAGRVKAAQNGRGGLNMGHKEQKLRSSLVREPTKTRNEDKKKSVEKQPWLNRGAHAEFGQKSNRGKHGFDKRGGSLSSDVTMGGDEPKGGGRNKQGRASGKPLLDDKRSRWSEDISRRGRQRTKGETSRNGKEEAQTKNKDEEDRKSRGGNLERDNGAGVGRRI